MPSQGPFDVSNVTMWDSLVRTAWSSHSIFGTWQPTRDLLCTPGMDPKSYVSLRPRWCRKASRKPSIPVCWSPEVLPESGYQDKFGQMVILALQPYRILSFASTTFCTFWTWRKSKQKIACDRSVAHLAYVTPPIFHLASVTICPQLEQVIPQRGFRQNLD